MTLRDPDVCRCGSRDTRVVRRERGKGYLRRRHKCLLCGQRWPSYQTLISPKRLTARY